MIKLYQFETGYGAPNLSLFCVKVETFLKMAGLEYEVSIVDDPRKAPKGKMPYIEDDGKIIADSTFILQHLQSAYGVNLDTELTPEEAATAHAFSRMMEERLYFILVYSRLNPVGK